jgi:hypothetical protein
MDGPKMKACIPLWRPMQGSKYSIPLEVHCVNKMFDYLPNGSVDSN